MRGEQLVHFTALGAITGRPAPPVLITRLERALDQQAAKTCAIEIEVGGNGFSAIQIYRVNETLFGAQTYVRHLALDALHASNLSITTKITREQAGVEMQGKGDA